MSRWNVLRIAFYGVGARRRDINFDLNAMNVITGASGTGKTAIIDAIDYCLGSSKCRLPFFVRGHAVAVAVHWVNGDAHLIVGRNIPKAGSGTDQMFVRIGRNLTLPTTSEGLEGPTNRATARAMIEKAFGIADEDDPKLTERSSKGRATVRDVTPYLFISSDVIISPSTLLHDLNRPEKARDIKATMPYFLGAVDQASVLANRKLRQLEAALARLERTAKAQERSQTFLTTRSLFLLTQAHEVGLVPKMPVQNASDDDLLIELRNVSSRLNSDEHRLRGEERSRLEEERRSVVADLGALRSQRQSIKLAIREAAGYESAVSGQAHKLGLAEHLSLKDGRCPVCDAENTLGQAMAHRLMHSLEIVADEVASVDVMRPRLVEHLDKVEVAIGARSNRLREIEAQLSGLARIEDEVESSGSTLMERARIIGRIDQFLDTTVTDYGRDRDEIGTLRSQIDTLRDQVDPEGRRDRLRDSENLISTYATDMLGELPTEVPAKNARILFTSTPAVSIIEPERRAALTLTEIGSDQNYLAIHLALSFSLQKLFETIRAPVPGLLVIDQISRPYYPEGGDEKKLDEIASNEDRLAMKKIVRFLFEEKARQKGLQVILIEHAYIDDDPEYVKAVRGRWTKASGEKLIPPDWPTRN